MQTEQLLQRNNQSIVGISMVVYTSLALFVVYSIYKLKQARKRKRQINNKIKMIQKDKIVLAIEIKDFIVKYSQKYSYGYLPLQIIENINRIDWLRKKIFNLAHFYKPIFPVTKIKQFFNGLHTIQKLQVVLYTSLNPDIAEVIINKLGIQKYLPIDMRKYCDLQNQDDQKHAIEVDRDTRRVIIITPTYDDHYSENQKYFLVLRPKVDQQNYLKNLLKELKVFVEDNKNLNYLHDQLGEFKINYDSELSDFEN